VKPLPSVVPAAILSCVIAATAAARQAPPPAVAGTAQKEKPAVGEARVILPLPEGNHPEGIAIDPRGEIYVGNRRNDREHVVSEVLALGPDGSVSTLAVLAELDTEDPGGSGVLGLAVDSRGNVYAALVTFDPATHGVWRISRDGWERARLPGSEQIVFPNALTFDQRGDLFVTDSIGGALWRFRAGAHTPGEVWLQHELLEPAPDDPFGFPAPGANGIGFHPPDTLYVANTEKGSIVRVPIDHTNGSAGRPSLIASGPELLSVDGLAVDARGSIYAVIAGHAVLETSPLVHVDPTTGVTTPSVATSAPEFDVPLSLAFGRGARDPKSLYVTNGDLPGLPPEAHKPGVVQVNVSVPGFSFP
jgi:sugar lactone lactonase YvrE